MLEVWTNSSWNKQLLDLRTFAAEKLPDEGILVPKHIGFGIWYEVRLKVSPLQAYVA